MRTCPAIIAIVAALLLTCGPAAAETSAHEDFLPTSIAGASGPAGFRTADEPPAASAPAPYVTWNQDEMHVRHRRT